MSKPKRLSRFEQWVLSELRSKGEKSGRELKESLVKARWSNWITSVPMFYAKMTNLEGRGLVTSREVKNKEGFTEKRFSVVME